MRPSAALSIFIVAICAGQPVAVPMKSIQPRIARVVDEVSEDKIAAVMKHLETFGTRNVFSDQDNATRGKGAAASLALAPGTPVVTRTSSSGTQKGRVLPMLSRGKSSHDAVMKWKPAKDEADLAGYVVLIRSTTAPFWEREIYVGNVTGYTLKDTQIDDCVLAQLIYFKLQVLNCSNLARRRF